MADSTIKIRTQIDTKQAEVQLATLENRMAKTAEKAKNLRDSMSKMEGAKVPTAEYEAISNQLDKATKKFDELVFKQAQMASAGKTGTAEFDKLDSKVEELGSEIKYAEGELEQLVNEGKAFTLGENTQEYANLKGKLKDVEAEMDIQSKKHDILIAKQKMLGDKYKEAGEKGKESIKKVTKEAEKSGNAISKFGSRIKQMLAAMLIYNVIRKAISGLMNAVKEGFSNLASSFNPLKSQIDSLNASFLTLKNTLAAAFEPIVTACIPYIQKLVSWLTSAINIIGQFIAAISGRNTYTKAIKQSTAATAGSAAATKKEADALEDAEKAAKGYLSPIDEINKFQTNKDTTDTSGGGGAGTTDMFEEVPIDSKVTAWLEDIMNKLEPIKAYMEELKGLFKQGLFDGLGDWAPRFESIKSDISSIGTSLVDVFADPAVLASADRLVKSLAYTLGTLVGSIASIGLSLATNLVGGIEYYLSSNKDIIKQHLVTMFDVGSEISTIWSGFFTSLSTIFEAFASESGQQLTGSLIGIFTNAFMGLMELCAKFGRDLLDIITRPFIENQDAFRQALEGLFGILAEVAGTVKTAIDDAFATLNTVYDEHFAPFFQSIADGLSQIVGALLGFWNEHLQPLLSNWAKGFEDLWNAHLKPFWDSLVGFFGSVTDLIKALWENILVPFITFIINNILPLILPVLDQIWQTLVTLFGDIADIFTDFINIFKGIIDIITAVINGDWQAAWDGFKSIVANIINLILDIVKAFINLVINLIGTVIQTIIATVVAMGTSIIGTIVGIVTGIKDRIVALFVWIVSKIKGGMAEAKSAWDSAWNGFLNKVKSVWDSISSTINGVISKITGWINTLQTKWTNLKTGISNGLTSGVIGKLLGTTSTTTVSSDTPAFATGGVIPTGVGQHLAIVGDNNHETEVVSPLSTIKEALIEAMGTTNNSTTVKLYLDGNQIAESVVKAGRINQMSTGQNMFALS